MTDIQPILADGSAPATPADLFRRLEELGIDFRTVEHPAVFTVEESKAYRGELTGSHTKNLFLRNKKGRMWLLVCREDLAIDLKVLGETLGAGRLSFASPERLMRYLGVIPGAVTPFGVLNDTGGKVTVVIERAVLEDEPLNFHPLDNAMTTAVSASDLLEFLEEESHPPEIVELE
jgi:Ala-tRNA(Pro) deacylase